MATACGDMLVAFSWGDMLRDMLVACGDVLFVATACGDVLAAGPLDVLAAGPLDVLAAGLVEALRPLELPRIASKLSISDSRM